LPPPPALGETHSLSAENYSAKVAAAEEQKTKGVRRVVYGWLGLLALVVIVSYVGLWLFVPAAGMAKAHLVLLAFAVALGAGGGVAERRGGRLGRAALHADVREPGRRRPRVPQREREDRRRAWRRARA